MLQNFLLEIIILIFIYLIVFLQHIPKEILVNVFEEVKRVLSKEGLFLHLIDYSDQFSHNDSNISKIHFLRFSKKEFDSLAGNRFMYMNRLGHDDFQEIFDDLQLNIVFEKKKIDSSIIKSLNANDDSVKLHYDFKKRSQECLATTEAWFGMTVD